MMSFKLTPVNTLTSKQYICQWLIKGYMEEETLGMFFGKPASGKSLLAMDIAFCIGAGIDWNGNSTKQGKVVYLAGEGNSGFSKRFKVLEAKYNTTTANVVLSDMPVPLSDPNSVNEVYNEIRAACPDPVLIIIDTLHRNFGDGDENSAKDFSVFLYHITLLMKETGAAVLLVHHSGHGSSDRARGSSSIKAAMDVEYKIEKSDDLVTMSCTKSKEFEEPEPISFNLVTKPIPSWLDDDGNPIQSAILESTTYTVPVRKPSLSSKDSNVLQALDDAIAKKGIVFPQGTIAKFPDLAGVKAINLAGWRAEAYPLLDDGNTKPQAKQQAFIRSKKKLIAMGKVKEADNNFWVVI